MTKRSSLSAYFPMSMVRSLLVATACGDSEKPPVLMPGESPRYDQFVSQVEENPEAIDQVTIFPDDNVLEVTDGNGGSYATGYPANAEETHLRSLELKGIPTTEAD